MSAVDTAQLDLMFTELRLPTFKAAWAELAERADADGWPAARLLAALAEQEIADRARRRFVRISDEVERRFRTKWNIDFGRSGTSISGCGTRIPGCGTSIPDEVEHWLRGS